MTPFFTKHTHVCGRTRVPAHTRTREACSVEKQRHQRFNSCSRENIKNRVTARNDTEHPFTFLAGKERQPLTNEGGKMKMTAEELAEVLRKHMLWLESKEGGERANLSGANLYRADLSRANLSEANLSRANLYEANLYEANLSRANSCEVDLSEADLSRANLSEANLSRANLYEANLYEANLSRANLYEANLSEADLSRAILCNCDMRGAIITFRGQKVKIQFEEVE